MRYELFEYEIVLFHDCDTLVGGFYGGDGDLQYTNHFADILVGGAVGTGGVGALVTGDEVFALHLRGALKFGEIQRKNTVTDLSYKLRAGVGRPVF